MDKKMEWIKTSDRLPEPWITVLVAGGIAYHNPESNTWHSRTGNDTGKIIEWPVNDWAVLPSPYDLPEEIDITKTMYPSDMMKAGKCVNPSDGKICELPKPPTTLEARAIILAAEALIRALSCMTSDYDNGRSKAIATIGEALLHDAKEAGIL